ncbi:hypothetical protein CLOP_g23780 [Closterium sp. NIES-67]|nr:hypothetical protein CLOP_g23780 [Closterium sp. NIES-67]
MRVLLVTAAGDSKRLPWANPCGKPFVSFPLLAGDDPDGPPLTLFDHILAVSSRALLALPPNKGALFCMTGDVLPCFDASRICLPTHGALVVTAAAPLEVASRHGVILASDRSRHVASGQTSSQSHSNQRYSHLQKQKQQQQQKKQQHGKHCDTEPPQLVADLLQKPSVVEMVERGALCGTGGALLDTGIYVVCGDTWRDLIGLATSEHDLLAEVLAFGEELSLYEELASAWVPARHKWLSTRPIGSHLLAHLSSHSLFHHCADDLSFLHFGTSSEYLRHMRLAYLGQMPRRHLSVAPAPTECHVTQSATLISSLVRPGACVGEGSVVSDSTLVGGTRIGDGCIVIGVDTAAAESAHAETAHAESASAKSAAFSESASAESALGEASNHAATMPPPHGRTPIPSTTSSYPAPPPPPPLVLPSHMCLWQVPLKGGREVTLCCGVDDNPKLSVSGGGSFCGRPWGLWLKERGLKAADLWPETDNQGRPIHPKQDLWSALLFPILPRGSGLPLAMWLLGTFPPAFDQASSCHVALSQQQADTWRRSDRTSLALLHSEIDFPALLASALHRRSLLLSGFAPAAIDGSCSPADSGSAGDASRGCLLGATRTASASEGDGGSSAAIDGSCSPAAAVAAGSSSAGTGDASKGCCMGATRTASASREGDATIGTSKGDITRRPPASATDGGSLGRNFASRASAAAC